MNAFLIQTLDQKIDTETLIFPFQNSKYPTWERIHDMQFQRKLRKKKKK